MKKLIVLALLVVGVSSFAQGRKGQKGDQERKSPTERVENQVAKLTKELSLNADQASKIKTILTEKTASREENMEKFKEMKASGTKPSQEERDARKKGMEAQRAEMDSQMKSILNADQYAKWQAKKEDMKEKMQEKKSEKKSERKNMKSKK